ncbi:MAG TPA: hypothetical protein VK425_13240, partial [Acidimicrobiales bacterium]|nr:hypothetical protein [Acidimicrobiales bacterium]
MTAKVMVGSVVHREPVVLSQFLSGLRSLERDGAELSFYLIDDTAEAACGQLLDRFASCDGRCDVEPAGSGTADLSQHGAADRDIWRGAALKNTLITEALETGSTHLLLVDSGLLVPPPLLAHLLSLKKAIVAEVFWTEWQLGQLPLPSVWLCDE